MGIHDRDYMQAKARPFAAYRPGRLIWIIIAINAVLWFVYSGAYGRLHPPVTQAQFDASGFAFIGNAFMLWPDAVFAKGKVWQLFTSFWLHDPYGAQHVLLNMFMLFMFGRITETWIGPRRFLALYLGAGIFASLVYVGWALAVGSHVPALGASGAVYAVMVWLALQQPKSKVYLMMVIPMPMWLAVGVFMVGVEVFSLAGDVSGVKSTVSHVAHLGGAAFGAGFWFFARRFSVPAARQPAPRPDRTQVPSSLEESHRLTAMRVAVDALLAKVHEHGIGSLTPEEKAFLEKASHEMRGR